MKSIILAGGKGTRLHPNTIAVSKQLLPIYDKPMIYYPISVALLAGIKDILLISTPEDIENYKKLLGDGSRIGIELSYAIQEQPRGLAEALLIGEEFIGEDSVCLLLGDNIFYGQFFSEMLQEAIKKVNHGNAVIFGYPVSNPKEFGIIEFDENRKVISLSEKPEKPKSNFAVPGLYFYTNSAIKIAKNILPSPRGELEITSINEEYLRQEKLEVILMSRGLAWLDTGSPKGMLKAAQFVQTVQDMQGFYLSCIEELAWRKGFIDTNQLRMLGKELKNTAYGKYLLDLVEGV